MASHIKMSKSLLTAQEQLDGLTQNLMEAREEVEEEVSRLPKLGWDDENEVNIFLSQAKFVVPRQQRIKEFRLAMQRLENEFHKSEQLHGLLLGAQISKEIVTKGIDAARQLMVPAYVFHKFQKLPVELQRRIWSLAARSSCPQRHVFVSSPDGTWEEGYRGLLGVASRVESAWRSSNTTAPRRLVREHPSDYQIDRQTLSLFHACHLSRMVAADVFRPFSIQRRGSGMRKDTYAFFNTLYDGFYIAESYYTKNYTILNYLLIKLHEEILSGPQGRRIVEDLTNLQHVRNLSVALEIFVMMPTNVWSFFGGLELFTVVITCPSRLGEKLDPESQVFYTPHPENKWGRRTAWLLTRVENSLKEAKKELPGWTLPKIEVVVAGSSNDRKLGPEVTADDSETGGAETDDSVYMNTMHNFMGRRHSLPQAEVEKVLADYRRANQEEAIEMGGPSMETLA